MRFVGNNQIKVCRREQAPIFVVEQQRLDGGDDDFGLAPLIAALLVDHRGVIVFELRDKRFIGLVFEFQTIHQKQHSTCVAGAQKQLNDSCCRQGLTSAGGHFEQEAAVAFRNSILNRLYGTFLVVAQKTQPVFLDKCITLRRVVPACLGGVVRHLRQRDVVFADKFGNQALRVGLEAMIALNGIRRRKASDNMRISLLQVPKVMQIAVRENHKAAILGFSVLAGLFLANQRVLIF